jgi:hypothetical protein
MKSLPSGFLNRFILDPFCSNSLIIVVLLFQIVWINETHVRRPFSIFSWLYYFSFSSMHRTFLVFVTVATLYTWPDNILFLLYIK